MSIRRAMMIPAALAALLVCGQTQAEERVETVDGWKITIAPADAAAAKGAIDPADYQRIYNAIPFNRTEFNANPSYRHDAAMEILFGKMRKTVIHRHVQPVQPKRTSVYPNSVRPYQYNNRLRTYGVGYYLMWNARGLY